MEDYFRAAALGYLSRRLDCPYHPFFRFRLSVVCPSVPCCRGRSPDTASFEDVRRFELHFANSGADTPTLNHTVTALRFFFRVTLIRYRRLNAAGVVCERRRAVRTFVRDLFWCYLAAH